MTPKEQLLKKRDMPKLIRQMTLFQEFLFLGDFWGGKSQKSLKEKGEKFQVGKARNDWLN